MKLNLGSGLHKPEGYINVDKSEVVKPDTVLDLFEYPWPFDDNSVDEFICSHIVEHIPHEPYYREGGDYARWDYLKKYDGFYCFFGEIWRIAKPGALVRVTVPHGMSVRAFQDPTHVRFMVASSFAYLTAEMLENKDFNYQIPCLYTVEKLYFDMDASFAGKERDFERNLGYLWNIADTMHVELKVVK